MSLSNEQLLAKVNVICAKLESRGVYIGGGAYDKGKHVSFGHEAYKEVLRVNQTELENHLRRTTQPSEAFQLPELPCLNKSFGYDDAKDFLKPLLPPLLGVRPGYGEDKLHNKPVWWCIKWQSFGAAGFERNDFVKLIVSLYKHYGHYVDEEAIHWAEPKGVGRRMKRRTDTQDSESQVMETEPDLEIPPHNLPPPAQFSDTNEMVESAIGEVHTLQPVDASSVPIVMPQTSSDYGIPWSSVTEISGPTAVLVESEPQQVPMELCTESTAATLIETASTQGLQTAFDTETDTTSPQEPSTGIQAELSNHDPCSKLSAKEIVKRNRRNFIY